MQDIHEEGGSQSCSRALERYQYGLMWARGSPLPMTTGPFSQLGKRSDREAVRGCTEDRTSGIGQQQAQQAHLITPKYLTY